MVLPGISTRSSASVGQLRPLTCVLLAGAAAFSILFRAQISHFDRVLAVRFRFCIHDLPPVPAR